VTTNVLPPATDFYQAFASRVRETLADVEHSRTPDTAATHRAVDAYLTREYPHLFPAAPQPADPGHFAWCTTHRTEVCDDGTRYTEHEGQQVSVPAPPGMATNGCDLLHATLYLNESSVVAETLLGFGGSGEGTVLTAAEADQVIEHLETFVRQLRGMRAQMGTVGGPR
jgi:hypothetical protein